MIIEKDRAVSIIYQLREGNESGQVVEQLEKSAPLTFLYGRGNLLPKFEENLNGLKVGDTFKFMLSHKDSYGDFNEQAVINVPKNIFEVDGKMDENLVFVGNMIPMRDNEGNRLNGKVLEIKDDTIIMDFNHPMAGKDLHFDGEVVEVREATTEELELGHIPQAGEGCSSCGSDADSCGSDCGC